MVQPCSSLEPDTRSYARHDEPRHRVRRWNHVSFDTSRPDFESECVTVDVGSGNVTRGFYQARLVIPWHLNINVDQAGADTVAGDNNCI